MSEKIKDGGSAFPEPGVYDQSRDQINPVGAYYDAGGMTLRDYFAAKSIDALIIQGWDDSDIARRAYATADAMLAAREAKS